MNINLTAGVFMVLMVAIAAAIFLCCFKAYVFCRNRRSNQRQPITRILPRSERRFELPVADKCLDNPPEYGDIISGKVQTILLNSCHSPSASVSIENEETKSEEDMILVTWSPDGSADNAALPSYSCVVMDEASDVIETAPPPYTKNTLPRINSGNKKKEQTLGNTAPNHFLGSNKAIESISSRYRTLLTFFQKDDTASNLSSINNFISVDNHHNEVLVTLSART